MQSNTRKKAGWTLGIGLVFVIGVATWPTQEQKRLVAAAIAELESEDARLAAKCDEEYKIGEDTGCALLVPSRTKKEYVLVAGFNKRSTMLPYHLYAYRYPGKDSRPVSLDEVDLDRAIGPNEPGYLEAAAIWLKQRPE